jgi:hypothetical protein
VGWARATVHHRIHRKGIKLSPYRKALANGGWQFRAAHPGHPKPEGSCTSDDSLRRPSGYSTSAGYKNIINSYFSNVGAASGATTNDYSVATHYYDGAGKIAYSASNGGSTVDVNPYPASGCVS